MLFSFLWKTVDSKIVAIVAVTNVITIVTIYCTIDSGLITITPGNPAGPWDNDNTFINVAYAEPTAEPINAPTNGYFNFKFTPNTAGSVIPNRAEIPDFNVTFILHGFYTSFTVSQIIS